MRICLVYCSPYNYLNLNKLKDVFQHGTSHYGIYNRWIRNSFTDQTGSSGTHQYIQAVGRQNDYNWDTALVPRLLLEQTAISFNLIQSMI